MQSNESKESKKTRAPLSALRRSDKIILGVVSALVALTILLGILQRCGLSLVNTSVMLFLPILALFALVGWGAYALIRRMKNRVARIATGAIVGLVMMMVLMLGSTYLSFVSYTVLPHSYKTVADPNGGHKLVLMWQFDADAERSEASVEARKAARLEAYPDSSPETVADDLTLVFKAYPRVLGLFYRSNADVDGEVCLAYTGNVAVYDVIPAPEGAEGETAEPTVIETPHGTMMLEWLDDNATAHFYVKDPGVAEGGECTVRFAK